MTEQQIYNAVWRSMYLRMTVGDFDPAEMVPYQSIGPDHLNTPQNQVFSHITDSIAIDKGMCLLIPSYLASGRPF